MWVIASPLGTTSDPVVEGHKARGKWRVGEDKRDQKAMTALVGGIGR
jgi:hypothetical protein